jgi:uncharacterized protein (DUF2062 family)
MIKRYLKKTTTNDRLQALNEKYKIPIEYIQITRRMVSNAVLIGVLIAFIPMPFQMLVVLAFIPFVRFNVPIALAMCWITNPLTMPFIYYIEYITGSFLLGIEIKNVEMSIDWFIDNMGNIFIPLYFGAFIYSTGLALFLYFLVNYLWKKSTYNEKKLHRHERMKKN